MNGFLNLRKPAGLTSHRCVAVVRRLFDTRQVGHGGTLDPMATGVLTVAVGRATRFLQFLSTGKEYTGVVRLGITTDSDDVTGDEMTRRAAPWVNEELVRSTLQTFVGDIEQMPPKVSAIKKDGVRLYKLARAKKDFEVTPRKVHISRIDVEKFTAGEFPEASIRVVCGGGTYIRSIARECGEALTIPPELVDDTCQLRNLAGEFCVGGTLAELERTRSGAFHIADSLDFDEVEAKLEAGESPLRPIASMLGHLPFTELSPEVERLWLNGLVVPIALEDVAFAGSEPAQATLTHGEYVRICRPGSPILLGVSQVEQQSPYQFVLRKRLFI